MAVRTQLPIIHDQPTDPNALADRFARRIRYLRVSLTDRCNYRCVYCMPETMEFRPRAEILTFEEIVRLLGVFAGLGVRRVRLTGGEPTVRADVVDLVGKVAAVPGIESVVMTTNGHLLDDLAAPLASAGLREVNVSIDSLDAERFRALTRRGDLARVIAGIDAARAAGMRVKLNAVALRGSNDHEVAALCAFGWDRGATPRFIEHMPMSDGTLYQSERQLTAAEIRASVAEAFGPLEPSSASEGAGADTGPARYWHLRDTPSREVGIISAMTEHFCDTCNRLRLSAIGELHACLAYDDATDLRSILRSGGTDDDLRAGIRAAVEGKRAGHEFQSTGQGAPRKHMIAIGG
jgi:cyclic pyranopterin phosphate synthase